MIVRQVSKNVGGMMLTLMPAAKSTARCGTKTRTGFPHTKDTDHTISAQAFRAGGWAQVAQGAPAQRGMAGWRDMFHTVSFLVPRPRSPFVDGTAAGCGTSHPAVLPFTTSSGAASTAAFPSTARRRGWVGFARMTVTPSCLPGPGNGKHRCLRCRAAPADNFCVCTGGAVVADTQHAAVLRGGDRKT